MKKERGKTRKWIKKRTQKGFYANIVKELRLEDSGAYKEMTRMNYDTFLTLLSFIEPYISPQDTYFGTKPIKADERLTITIRFLMPLDPWGDTFEFLEKMLSSSLHPLTSQGHFHVHPSKTSPLFYF